MEEEIRPQKKKFRFDLIVLIILIVASIFVASYFLRDSSVVGQCDSDKDCGAYNVFYMKGSGYVCTNSIAVHDNSIKTRVLLFKYASKKAVQEKPTGCSCINNQCEIN